MAYIIPTAEPFYFPGDRIGCLLVHGFTGTPKEMRWMGEYLAEQGHSVLGIRLAFHATKQDDMLRARWQDWIASVEDGFNLLRGHTDHLFIMGLSMGSALSLTAATLLPVDGVVAMSTPYALGTDWRLPYLKYFSLLQPTVPKGPPDWHNPEAALDHIDYPTYTTRAVAELHALLQVMRQALPKITVPVLVIHSRQDLATLPLNAERVFASLGTAEKTLLWLEDSGHVITREPERIKVFEAAEAFICRLASSEREG